MLQQNQLQIIAEQLKKLESDGEMPLRATVVFHDHLHSNYDKWIGTDWELKLYSPSPSSYPPDEGHSSDEGHPADKWISVFLAKERDNDLWLRFEPKAHALADQMEHWCGRKFERIRYWTGCARWMAAVIAYREISKKQLARRDGTRGEIFRGRTRPNEVRSHKGVLHLIEDLVLESLLVANQLANLEVLADSAEPKVMVEPPREHSIDRDNRTLEWFGERFEAIERNPFMVVEILYDAFLNGSQWVTLEKLRYLCKDVQALQDYGMAEVFTVRVEKEQGGNRKRGRAKHPIYKLIQKGGCNNSAKYRLIPKNEIPV